MPIKDIEQHNKRWLAHKEADKKGIIGLSNKNNSKLILEFLKDYELGMNTGNSKGSRSPATLNKYREKLIFFDNHFKKELTKISKEELHLLLRELKTGIIKKLNGDNYQGVEEFVKIFKPFDKWLVKTGKKKVLISEDLSRKEFSKNKPAWVYLVPEEIKKLLDNANGDYRAIISFFLDSGIRPQEAYRVRISDFSLDFKELEIRDEISKTFGRKIKLMLSSELLKSYVSAHKLKDDDLLIIKEQPAFNKYLKSLAIKHLGDKTTKARGKTSEIRIYDLRHNSACYWLPKYSKEPALKYRFGWTSDEMISYYTEFLGMKDNITDEDLLTQENKSEYVKKIEKISEENKKLRDGYDEVLKNVAELRTYLDLLKKKGISPSV